MSDSDKQLDREAKRAVKRIETQRRLEGKLDRADATEGAAYLLTPLLLGLAGGVAFFLTAMGVEGVPKIIVGVPLLIGLLVLVLDRAHWK